MARVGSAPPSAVIPSGARSYHVGGGRSSGSLDFAILCAQYDERRNALGFDPRRSPESTAARLGVSPATVRRRLTEWRRDGFFLGFDVLPHPGLLGGRFAVRVLEFPNSVAQSNAIAKLRSMDGVIQMIPSNTLLMVAYFVESRAQADRRARQLTDLEGVRAVGAEMVFDFPPCTRKMSRSDWRLVQALRRDPEARLSDLASSVGHSVRTTSRRFDALLDEAALMFDPILDYARFSQSLAELVVFLDEPSSAPAVEEGVRALWPDSMRSWGPTPTDPADESAHVEFTVMARNSADMDELLARVAHLSGIEHVLLWQGRSTLPVRAWLDERIDRLVA